MSVAYVIVSETPIEGFDLFVNGKALAHASDRLDELAEAAGVRPLMDFFSMDPEEVDALFEGVDLAPGPGDDPALSNEDDADGGDDAPDLADLMDEPPGAEEWYTADEGLVTVRALIQAVGAAPAPAVVDPFDPPTEAILADLREFESVLARLAADGIRWHLMVDF